MRSTRVHGRPGSWPRPPPPAGSRPAPPAPRPPTGPAPSRPCPSPPAGPGDRRPGLHGHRPPRRPRRHHPRAAGPHATAACRVFGGDLVVHQARRRRARRGQPDPARPARLSTTTPVGQGRGRVRRAWRRSAANRGDHRRPGGRRDPAAGRRRHRRPPRLAWEVVSGGVQADGTPSRLRRTSTPAPAGAAHRAGDPDRRRAPASRSTAAPCRSRSRSRGQRTSSRTPPAAARSPPTWQQGRTRSSARSSARAARTARRSAAPTRSFGNGTNSNRESAGVDAQYGGATDVRLLQARARPQRHLRQRHRRATTGCTTARATSTRSGTAPR